MLSFYVDACANSRVLSQDDHATFFGSSLNVVKWGARSVCHVTAAVVAILEMIALGALSLVGHALSCLVPNVIFPEKALRGCDRYRKEAMTVLVRNIDSRSVVCKQKTPVATTTPTVSMDLPSLDEKLAEQLEKLKQLERLQQLVAP